MKIAPHANDTLLLLSALGLLYVGRISQLAEPWLMTKLALLVAYITLGFGTHRVARTAPGRIACFTGAVLAFGSMVVVAMTKSPHPFGIMGG